MTDDREDKLARLGFDGGPLDGTRLAADIAATSAGRRANAESRYADWRADLKRRIAARLQTEP